NRSVEAASRLLGLLATLEEKFSLSVLPPDLEGIARLRLDNPEASMSQLAAMVTPALTKSGVNHRLKKLEEYILQKGLV
ncbi:MAG: DNA-binding protein WhiA, partial [Clostridia bacterium]|nr:DNA-binding protein WhiA [Clostridia bacterium]